MKSIRTVPTLPSYKEYSAPHRLKESVKAALISGRCLREAGHFHGKPFVGLHHQPQYNNRIQNKNQ